jgi:glutamine synthetase
VGLGYTIRNKEGYYPVPPADHFMDLRAEMALELEKWGIAVEMQHHEVATAGQAEIDMKFDSLLKMADNLMTYKYVIKNVAARNGQTVTFMPKPLFGDNGSGMHVHQSIWKDGKPLFYDAQGLRRMLADDAVLHRRAADAHQLVSRLRRPTTNSYKRLVPHYEAPVNVAFSARNRSAAVRIPMYFQGSPKSKRLEFRPPDPSCNPYLAFAAMLCAGIDGIKKKIDPVSAGFGPLDKNIYDLPPEEARKLRSVPGSLNDTLAANCNRSRSVRIPTSSICTLIPRSLSGLPDRGSARSANSGDERCGAAFVSWGQLATSSVSDPAGKVTVSAFDGTSAGPATIDAGFAGVYS